MKSKGMLMKCLCKMGCQADWKTEPIIKVDSKYRGFKHLSLIWLSQRISWVGGQNPESRATIWNQVPPLKPLGTLGEAPSSLWTSLMQCFNHLVNKYLLSSYFVLGPAGLDELSDVLQLNPFLKYICEISKYGELGGKDTSESVF